MWGLPAILSSATDMDSATLSLVLGIGNPAYIMKLFGCMTLFLVGGYLFYSSIYAAIGSSVDNIQDASQLTSFATMPIIIGLLLAFTVVNDPTSQLAFWTSMIPFTSPMVMMSRMPFGVAGWEIAEGKYDECPYQYLSERDTSDAEQFSHQQCVGLDR